MNKRSALLMVKIVFLSDTFVFEKGIQVYGMGRVERLRFSSD